MRALALTAALLLPAVPGTSAAVTIPLADSSTFMGSVGSELLGVSEGLGLPAGGATGSITFTGDLDSTVEVAALHFGEYFEFVPQCSGGGDGYFCPVGSQIVTVSLDLEGPGSVVIDGQGHASGELQVTLGSDLNAQEAAATLIVNVFGFGSTLIFDPTHLTEDPRSGSFRVEGTLQFDNPGSPFASLQGVTLVSEPGRAEMVLVTMTMAAVMAGARRRTLRSCP